MGIYMDTSKHPILVLSTRYKTKESTREWIANPETRAHLQCVVQAFNKLNKQLQWAIQVAFQPLVDFCEGRNEQAIRDFPFEYQILCLMMEETHIRDEEFEVSELGRESYGAILKGLHELLKGYPVVYEDLKPLPRLSCDGTNLEDLTAEEYGKLFTDFAKLNPWEMMRRLKKASYRIKDRLIYLEASSRKNESEDTIHSLDSAKKVVESFFSQEVITEQEIFLEFALLELPPREYEVLRLKYWEGLSQEDIAKRFRISQPMVSKYEKKAIQKLRTQKKTLLFNKLYPHLKNYKKRVIKDPS